MINRSFHYAILARVCVYEYSLRNSTHITGVFAKSTNCVIAKIYKFEKENFFFNDNRVFFLSSEFEVRRWIPWLVLRTVYLLFWKKIPIEERGCRTDDKIEGISSSQPWSTPLAIGCELRLSHAYGDCSGVRRDKTFYFYYRIFTHYYSSKNKHILVDMQRIADVVYLCIRTRDWLFYWQCFRDSTV